MSMKTTTARILRSLAAAVGAVPIVLIDAPAGAAPCPDVEIVFARGTTEPPG
jgi:cutinase